MGNENIVPSSVGHNLDGVCMQFGLNAVPELIETPKPIWVRWKSLETNPKQRE